MGVALNNESELSEALAAVFDASIQSGWVLLSFVGPRTLHFSAGGEGGAGEVVDHLEDDQVQFFKIRHNNKDVFVTWRGPNANEGDASAAGDAQSFLQPFHTETTVGSKEELGTKFS